MSDTKEELFPQVAEREFPEKRYKHRKVTFKTYEQDKEYLFPQSTDDYVSKMHIARLISRIVETIDLSQILATYIGGGTSAYDPRMLLKVWLLGFIYRVYTSRKLSRMLEEHVAFIWISGATRVDFHTLSNFRMRLKEDIKQIFKEIVIVGMKLGIITGETVFIDNTKIGANGNRHKMVWRKQVEKQLQRIEGELELLFRHIDEENRKEDQAYGDADATNDSGSYDMNALSEFVNAINRKLKDKTVSREEAREERKKARRAAELIARKSNYEMKKGILGKRNSYSSTDPEATAMLMKDGVTIAPGYNEGIAAENQFVINYTVSDNAADTVSFKELLEGAIDNLGEKPDAAVADAGYGSEENYEYLEKKEITGYVKYNTYHKEKNEKWRNEKLRFEDFIYCEEGDYYICKNDARLEFCHDRTTTTPTGYEQFLKVYHAREEDCRNCPYKDRCTDAAHRTLTVNENYNRLKMEARSNLDGGKGKILYKMRGTEVETVFGDRKQNHGIRRYVLRGKKKVMVEAGFYYIAYDIKKIYRFLIGKLFSFKLLYPAIDFG